MDLTQAQIRAIKAKKQGNKWSIKIPLDHQTVKLLENNEGLYELLNKDGKRIYIGSSNILRHRLESYKELDDPKVHPTKVEVRKEAMFFRFKYLPIDKARIQEQRIKQSLPLNMDNHRNEQRRK